MIWAYFAVSNQFFPMEVCILLKFMVPITSEAQVDGCVMVQKLKGMLGVLSLAGGCPCLNRQMD